MVVLGLLARHGPLTSYEMKQHVAESVGSFWSFPHSQLYAEPQRLAAAGLVGVEVEQGGRRRRTYSILPPGAAALEDWISQPSGDPTEIRDLGLLKLFFASPDRGESLAALARARLEFHNETLRTFEGYHASMTPPEPESHGSPVPPNPEESGAGGPASISPPLMVLECGLTVHRAMAAFWESVLRRAEHPDFAEHPEQSAG